MEVKLAVSCINSKVKNEQKRKIKDSVFGHLHLKLNGISAKSKHRNTEHKIAMLQARSPASSHCALLSVPIIHRYVKSASQ